MGYNIVIGKRKIKIIGKRNEQETAYLQIRYAVAEIFAAAYLFFVKVNKKRTVRTFF